MLAARALEVLLDTLARERAALSEATRELTCIRNAIVLRALSTLGCALGTPGAGCGVLVVLVAAVQALTATRGCLAYSGRRHIVACLSMRCARFCSCCCQ